MIINPIHCHLNYNSENPLYIQLYEYIKTEILRGAVPSGEKLPSLRELSRSLSVSLTTVEGAYNQLLVEGYIRSKPQSGYYVAEVFSSGGGNLQKGEPGFSQLKDYTLKSSPYLYDLECFDFLKWKKCAAKVLNQYSHLLLFESDPQGEAALRYEIAKYLYHSRGVNAKIEQIVIGAGTQQITSHLARILQKMGVQHVSLEMPGYLSVQSMFTDAGFILSHIPVGPEGIHIDRLPVNISSAVYVSPSNQFPTGAVMPAGRRYELLHWAADNDSIIIEDDYDSELRYFGKPLPALQGLDTNQRVVYLGSFSSTLFPAIKISYMVLPERMGRIFEKIKDQYTQTCSKAEQLTLAFFMEDGYYYTGIRKLRSLYAQKLQLVLQTFHGCGKDFVEPVDTRSGINMTLKIRSEKSPEELSSLARDLKLHMIPLSRMTGEDSSRLIFYYNQVPLQRIPPLLEELIRRWRSA